MDAGPAPRDGPARISRGLAIGWGATGAAWIAGVGLSFAGVGFPVLLIALFSSASLAILVVLALWKRTRDVWDAMKRDDRPSVYLMWTVLGATAATMFTLEGWALVGIGFFSWMPAWSEWVPMVAFGLPIAWPVARTVGYMRLRTRANPAPTDTLK